MKLSPLQDSVFLDASENDSGPEDQGFICDYLEQNLRHSNKATVLIPGLLQHNISEPK